MSFDGKNDEAEKEPTFPRAKNALLKKNITPKVVKKRPNPVKYAPSPTTIRQRRQEVKPTCCLRKHVLLVQQEKDKHVMKEKTSVQIAFI